MSLTIHAMTSTTMDAFAAVGSDAARAERVAAFMREIFALGECRPAWCFVAERDGVAIARVAFVSFPPDYTEFELYVLVLPDTPDAVTVGKALVQGGKQAPTLRLAFDPTDPRAADKRALAEALGWPLVQEKVRYTRTTDAHPVVAALTFRSFDDVGEATFTAAVARILQATADRGLQTQTAAAQVAELRHLDGRTHGWELAYDGDNMVGLIVPQVLDGDMGVLNLVGVLPEARGRGYAKALVARGLLTLAPEARIVADVDPQNPSMAAALRYNGFTETSRREVYVS